ncbi:site-specific integrase [Citrobacter freundii]|nr:site-specific integrase [Citrobacter freundii]
MVVSDLKERIAYDDKPSLHRAEANTVLDELPHLKATLSEYDYQVIARMVAQAKVKSLQDTRSIILGGDAGWLSSSQTTEPSVTEEPIDALTISKLLDLYAKHNKAKGHSKRTKKKYEWYGALLLSSFGDVPVHTITGAMGREFYDNITKLPVGLQKEVLLASKLSQLIDNNTGKTINVVTANGHHGKINHFFEWVVDRKHIASSPFPSVGIPMPKKNHKDDRAAISDTEAKLVFSHALFSHHIGIKTKLVQHPHHFFLPLICLFTGMRAGEVSQLYIDDIVEVNGVHCFLVDKRRDDQWLKTPNAKRFVPVHKELIRLGFLLFINDLKDITQGDARLFNNIPLIQDSYSAKPSEWFIRNFRDALDQPSHVTLHGFRHMFRDKLVNLTDSDERICRLMGHQTNSYGNSLLADQQVMQGLVNSIDFSGITSNVRPYTSLSMFHQLKGRA